MINLPSLALALLKRSEAAQVLWSDIEAQGARTEAAARHLVALQLCVPKKEPRAIAITRAGRIELLDRNVRSTYS